MSGFNLPPGVSQRDIPGNRPQDELWERVTANVRGMTVDDFSDSLKTEAQRQALDALIEVVVDRRVDQAMDARHEPPEAP
jgi:hypothetical protein